ncbi:hypothetical protein BN132_523 [Cronobacter turicensis 564]|nr:hypothetical protein BN132_523 [Cronobacter turicensis 564]
MPWSDYMTECKVLEMDLNAACWVVRPGKSSAYYNEFLFGEVAAIGHLDDYVSEETILDEDTMDDVFKKFYVEEAKEGSSKQAIASSLTQAYKFLFEMEVGDLIFTIGNGSVVAGVITTDAYISEEPICIGGDIGTESKHDLNFKIRRGVDWGRAYPRESIPLAVKKSFMANQTVFSATEHIKNIYHWLHVVFISEGVVYTSSKINQADDIHHYSVTKYSETLNSLEALATIIEDNFCDGEISKEISIDDILSRLDNLAFNEELNLTTQQVFMSPGDYWNGFTGKTKVAKIAFTIAMCALFNVKPVFASPDEQQIAEKLYTPISEVVEELKEKNNMALVERKLSLSLPKQNKKIVNKIEELNASRFPKVSKSDKGMR